MDETTPQGLYGPAVWFSTQYDVWRRAHPRQKPHLRHIHYWLVSLPEPPLMLPPQAGPDKGMR
jgi:hypothetical protein